MTRRMKAGTSPAHACPTPRQRRRTRSLPAALAGLLLLVGGALFLDISTAQAEQEQAHHGCLRCHAMATLGYRDPDTNRIIHLAIDPQQYQDSVHGGLSCTKCHEFSFRLYPHSGQAANDPMSCANCHQDDPKEAQYHFATIKGEYEKSVHALSKSPKLQHFGCDSCHDPHGFVVSKVGEPLSGIVRKDNQICLSCHRKLLDPLNETHEWLPNRDKHWSAVRCIDCHTPRSEHPSHQILKAADSSRDCVNCHSQTTRLLDGLYRYRARHSVQEHGWINMAIFNESYIVGMSRSPAIDWLSLAIIALVLLAITVHAVARYRIYKKTRRESR